MVVAMDPPLELSTPGSGKFLPKHLERLAVVYVRQSSVQQIMDHRESTKPPILLGEACPRPRLARGARPGVSTITDRTSATAANP